MHERLYHRGAPLADGNVVKSIGENAEQPVSMDSNQVAGGAGACELFTPDEFAGILKINKRTLWRKLSKGELPKPFYVGAKTPRWRAADVQAWINGKETT